ncbi:MAG: response regulator [Elusimicrobia bacterium]|nr:response regulator [Elusimicrobiota bacterium]
MSLVIGILCPEDGKRRDLALLAGESGYLAHPASRLDEALEVLRERRPSLMLVTDGPDQDAEVLVREIAAVSPLVPVVVALGKRDAGRAVALMRLGVCEVVAPPWTREDLGACLGKTLRTHGTAFSIVPLKGPLPSGTLYTLVVSLFFALAIGHVALQRQAQLRSAAYEEKKTWDLPYRYPTAASFNGPELWVLDWFTQSIFVHPAKDLEVARVTYFPGELPVAFSVASDALWAVTPGGKVCRRMKDDKLRLLQEFPGAAPDSVAIVFDGLYLWTANAKTKTLRKHLNDYKLTALGTWRYPGDRPAALVFDGRFLWSLDAGSRELLCHNLERPDEVLRRVPLPEYRDGVYRPVGLAWDGEKFWTVADSAPAGKVPARVFRHSLSQR